MANSSRFIVGQNDNGTYYEVAHLDSCSSGKRIGSHRGLFDTLEEALAAATEHRLVECCQANASLLLSDAYRQPAVTRAAMAHLRDPGRRALARAKASPGPSEKHVLQGGHPATSTDRALIPEDELALLLDACRQLPPAQGNYLETDYVRNLMLTVLDLQMQGTTVERAMAYFQLHRAADVRTLIDLQDLFAFYSEDQKGNTALAEHLWGYRLWTRASMLRNLASYFASIGVTDQAALRQWACTSDFERDFESRVKGLSIAAYQWLVMRQGVETVKPDVHLHRFVRSVLAHAVSDSELIRLLEQVAGALQLKAYELDWRIWEHQRGSSGNTEQASEEH